MRVVSLSRLSPSAEGHRIDRYSLALAVVTVAAIAWVLLALWHADGHGLVGHGSTGSPIPADPASAAHAHHGSHPHHAQPAAVGLTTSFLAPTGAAVGGWALMVVAMMLPPALPLLQTVERLVSRRRSAWLLVALSTGTFVAAWTVVGVVLIAGQHVVGALADGLSIDHDGAWAAGAVVLGAGLYQFSSLKERCLRGCRSPRSFVLAHWQGRRSASAELVHLTAAYAGSCIGCCWALMVICFAVGTAALPVMVALTVVMAAERLVPWGQSLVRPTGLALIGLGAVLLADPTVGALADL